MNILTSAGLLMCICMAYASALPSPLAASSSELSSAAPEAPVETLVPEEARWGGGGWGGGGWGGGHGGHGHNHGHGHGWGHHGGGGWGGRGWGGGGGGWGGWGGGGGYGYGK